MERATAIKTTATSGPVSDPELGMAANSGQVPGAGSVLLREAGCVCGGGCPSCQAKSALNVSQPNDPAEIEADQMADRVMRMSIADAKPKPHLSNRRNVIHRKCDACDDEDEQASETPVLRKEAFVKAEATPPPDDTPPSIKNVISSGGQPLDRQTRRFFEPRFGTDLSHVRIHTDSAAGQSARSINARAYALGSNIVFGSGEYAPDSERGLHLIAHELTHVGQQLKNTTLGVQRYVAVNVLITQLTAENAEQMTDEELDQEMYRLRTHLNTIDPTSPDYVGVVQNLHVLESVAFTRRHAADRGPSRRSTGPPAEATTTGTESPSSATAALSSAELIAEASRMTPGELSEEITILRSLLTGVSDDSFENLTNQERLHVFERELIDRDSSVLEHADSVRSARESFDLPIGDVFVSGFVAGSLQQIPPGEILDFFRHDLPEHPIDFSRGCEEGVGIGFLDGANNLIETVTSVVDLFMRAVMLAAENQDSLGQFGDDAVQELAYQVLGEEIYSGVAADTSYLERRRTYELQVNRVISALQSFGEALAHDPTLVLQWSGDLGLALGQSFGQSVTEDFLRVSPRQQGVVVGRIIGQILFEIILELVLAAATEGAGNAIRAGTGLLRGIEASAELGNILREMARASAAVRRLLRMAETGEEVVDLTVDAARLTEGAAELASTRRAESLGTTFDEAHVPGIRTPSESGVTTRIPEGSPHAEPTAGTETPTSPVTEIAEGRSPSEPSVDTETRPAEITETHEGVSPTERAVDSEMDARTPAVVDDSEALSSDSAPATTTPTGSAHDSPGSVPVTPDGDDSPSVAGSTTGPRPIRTVGIVEVIDELTIELRGAVSTVAGYIRNRDRASLDALLINRGGTSPRTRLLLRTDASGLPAPERMFFGQAVELEMRRRVMTNPTLAPTVVRGRSIIRDIPGGGTARGFTDFELSVDDTSLLVDITTNRAAQAHYDRFYGSNMLVLTYDFPF